MNVGEIEALAVVVFLLFVRGGKRRSVERRAKLRRLKREQWLMQFRRRLTHISLLFIMILSCVSLNASIRQDRILWEKQRSSDWWEHVVLSTFNSEDWLDNF